MQFSPKTEKEGCKRLPFLWVPSIPRTASLLSPRFTCRLGFIKSSTNACSYGYRSSCEAKLLHYHFSLAGRKLNTAHADPWENQLKTSSQVRNPALASISTLLEQMIHDASRGIFNLTTREFFFQGLFLKCAIDRTREKKRSARTVIINKLLLKVAPGYENADALPPEISFMSNRFELRELDTTIEKIFLGEAVRVLPRPGLPKARAHRMRHSPMTVPSGKRSNGVLFSR
jgi:hypothetical protein